MITMMTMMLDACSPGKKRVRTSPQYAIDTFLKQLAYAAIFSY